MRYNISSELPYVYSGNLSEFIYLKHYSLIKECVHANRKTFT